jgi:tetratricopeptide (TPR) repeat protein
MNPEFVVILQKLIAEQGVEPLLNTARCKAFLADYTRGEYKKESRFLLQALDAGVQKAIDKAENITICKKQQIRLLNEDYGLDEKIAADVVNTLVLVLRGDDQKSDVEALIEKGKEYYNSKDYDNANKQFDEAINVLNTVIRLDKNDASAYARRGEAYYRKGKYDDAIRDLDKAIRLDPNDGYAYVCRGDAYRKKGQYDAANKDYSEAIRLDPKYALSYIWCGITHHDKDQYDAAIKDFNEAIRLDPNDDYVYVCRGLAYKQKGQIIQAIQDIKKALSLNPNSEWARQELEEIQ